MPNAAVLLVDAAEQKGTRAVGQQRHPARERGDVVEVWTARCDQVLEQRLGSGAHSGQGGQGAVEVVLLRLQLRIARGRGDAHHGSDNDKRRANSGAQKPPDIPGILTLFGLSYKASTRFFTFSAVRTLNL
jgi:hypothetical protein